ncbi:phage N-6-adenine-methyltransferase [Escherichia coli]
MKNDYGGSHTPKEIKDLWQTPKPVFRGMDREFEFVADVAANKANALVPRYITEEMDTLHYPWGAVAMPGEYVWLNPPYSNPGPFVDKAALEHSRNHIGCVMLLPADISVSWFMNGVETANECRLITRGRLAFINAATGKPASGNNKGSLFLIWHPRCRHECIFTQITRKELYARGTDND